MSDDFIFMRERHLDYPTFDADNHFYETKEAFTQFLPKQYEGYIKYVEVNNRTKLALKDKISDYIPNPTFTRVAPPGAWHNPDEHRRSVPGTEAFFSPEPRLQLMKELGIDRTLMWPTLASVLEERLWDDPDGAVAIIHALNQWIHEHWSFNYQDAIFSTPIISLALGADEAIKELQWIKERGARIFLIRVAPVPTLRGRKSFALPEFDPFWEAVQESGLVAGMHSGDPGYERYLNEWEGYNDAEFLPFVRAGSPLFRRLSAPKNAIHDAMASIIGHGLALRYPNITFLPVEYGWEMFRPFLHQMMDAYEQSPVLFDEDPITTFKRSIVIHPFHEPDPAGLAEIVGVDNIVWGSDFPHPEGMHDPLAYADKVEGMAKEDQAKIMGGNLMRLLKVSA
ncbi:MAG: amidohydrolase family protein [Acidimicrobiia bacterium]